MAGSTYSSQSMPLGLKNFTGGLNNTSGPLNVAENESSDLLNIDFNKFGSLLKRSGYTALNTTAISASPASDGLYWFQYVSSGSFTRVPINVAGTKTYSMNNLDGTWNDITGSVTITGGTHVDFDTFLGNCYMTNGVDLPWLWNGTGNCQNLEVFRANSYTFSIVSAIAVQPTAGATYTNNGITYTVIGGNAGNIVATGSAAPQVAGTLTRASGTGDNSITFAAYTVNVNLQNAKYVCLYNNYLFWANVTVAGVYYPTRIYWMDLQNPYSAAAANWIEVARNDGQEITGIKVLADRLVIYKTQSIYACFYTGDADIPFTLPGGGKTSSHVGCVAPWSIQEVDNQHIFLAYDGIYIFDGNGSQKISYKLDYTFLTELNRAKLSGGVSMVYKTKNRYLLGLPSASGSTNDTIIIWDYYNNAFSKYSGMATSSMSTWLIDGYDERPYFGDYSGFVYRTDTGKNDYPLNVKTAINAYYYTNWKAMDDLVNQKASLSCYIFYAITQGTLTFAYSYDFTPSDSFSRLFQMGGSGAVWGSKNWGAFNWAKGGGYCQRVDVDGRGRTVRYKFANNNVDEGFQIDGFGSFTNLETHS